MRRSAPGRPCLLPLCGCRSNAACLPSTRGTSSLCAAAGCQLARLQQLLQRCEDGRLALLRWLTGVRPGYCCAAAGCGDKGMALKLVELGTDVNCKDSVGGEARRRSQRRSQRCLPCPPWHACWGRTKPRRTCVWKRCAAAHTPLLHTCKLLSTCCALLPVVSRRRGVDAPLLTPPPILPLQALRCTTPPWPTRRT